MSMAHINRPSPIAAQQEKQHQDDDTMMIPSEDDRVQVFVRRTFVSQAKKTLTRDWMPFGYPLSSMYGISIPTGGGASTTGIHDLAPFDIFTLARSERLTSPSVGSAPDTRYSIARVFQE
jgi:hypothetical protein